MTLHRLCLGCLEDWTHSEDVRDALCPACKLEREIHRQPKGNWNGALTSEDWWGLTINDVAPEDLAEGFYVASITEGDRPLYRSSDSEYH